MPLSLPVPLSEILAALPAPTLVLTSPGARRHVASRATQLRHAREIVALMRASVARHAIEDARRRR